MLGNFLNKKMMGKMEEMQKQIAEIKERLNNIQVIGEAENGNIRVIANGNRLIHEIIINEEWKNNHSDNELAQAIKTACNRALEQAERVEQAEMSHAAMGILPNLK